MDIGAWWSIVHGVTKCLTQLNTHIHIVHHYFSRDLSWGLK